MIAFEAMLTRPQAPRASSAWRHAFAAAVMVFAASALAAAPVPGQKSFPSAQAASEALFDAVISADPREMRSLFGIDTDRLVPVRDEEALYRRRDAFARHWSTGNTLQPQGADHATLVLGSEGWPYPVPMVRLAEGRWVFDTRAGLQEVERRRIGRNELATINALHAFVEAQHDYAGSDRDRDGVAEYAKRIASRPGRRDGLYWDTAQGEAEPPLGTSAAGIAGQVQRGEPHRGYRYRLLTAQGAAARGGVQDYLVAGRLLRGFAAIASPARYGRDGVHTFIVNHDARVWSRDLGPGTAAAAAKISRFDPTPGWKPE